MAESKGREDRLEMVQRNLRPLPACLASCCRFPCQRNIPSAQCTMSSDAVRSELRIKRSTSPPLTGRLSRTSSRIADPSALGRSSCRPERRLVLVAKRELSDHVGAGCTAQRPCGNGSDTLLEFHWHFAPAARRSSLEPAERGQQQPATDRRTSRSPVGVCGKLVEN